MKSLPKLTIALLLAATSASLLLASSSFEVARAQNPAAMSCSELWYARNAIYARKGYCFKTDRARAVFGPGCFPPYGALNQWEQRRVNELQYWERVKGC